MNFAIFKLTFKKALNNPNEYEATLCMNQLMIEVNRPNEELIKNIIKGCMNAIQREGENIKKIRALMVDLKVIQILDRAICSKSKVFMVQFFKLGMFDYLIQLASFEKDNPSPTKGENLFGDTVQLERKTANVFFFRLLDTIREWDNKFGVDKSGKITKFREGYLSVFDLNSANGRLP